MLSIEMLPACNGDCLWITYGTAAARHHVLVDGGYQSTGELVRDRLAADAALRLELFILTHIDGDHISGSIQLFAGDELSATRVSDVWFNGWQHLASVPEAPEADDSLGAKQGEFFSAVLAKKQIAWNAAFSGAAVVVPGDGPLPTCTLPGGMKLTLLSPDAAGLRALRARWKAELAKAKIRPGDLDAAMKLLLDDRAFDTDELGGFDVDKLAAAKFHEDDSETNGSSIAALAEYDGHRMLLTGDAPPSVVAAALRRHGVTDDSPLALDVLKLSHHGSKNNTSPELLALLDYRHVLVSTNGDRFHHPDAEALARVVHGRNTVLLHFNYETAYTRPWLDSFNQKKWHYQADVGSKGQYLLTVAR